MSQDIGTGQDLPLVPRAERDELRTALINAVVDTNRAWHCAVIADAVLDVLAERGLVA